MVAVSGGADSVALLDLLVHLEPDPLKLVVAHLNHCLRGADSDGDEAFVSQLAAGYGIPCVARRSDVAAFARSSGLSLEDAGRRARYVFFAEVAKNHGATSIALAHHQDDQAETVLIRLLRGSGGTGLSAMASASGEMLKRPLLQVSRADIEQYLKGRGLTHRVDATNSDTKILRNSIRHELLPLLKKYNPKVSERLAATAEILAGDEELLDQMTASAYARMAARDGADVVFDVAALADEPRALRFRLYRRALSELRGDLQRIGLPHLESIDRLLTADRPSARVKLPGACFIQRNYEKLMVTSNDFASDVGWQLQVAGEGCYPLPTGSSLTVQLVSKPTDLDPGSPGVAYLDLERAPFPWLIRTFAPGDRFRPLGMAGEQKIKDLFINEKIPLHQRRRVPLLVSGGDIVWVAGVRMGAKARVMAESETVVRVEVLDLTP